MDHWKGNRIFREDIDYHHIIDRNHDHCTSFNADDINSDDALRPLNNVNRQSLPPFMSRSYITKSLRRNANKAECTPQQINNNTEVLNAKQIEEFEENYCNHNNNNNNNNSSITVGQTGCVISPPAKFFRENSKPYPSNDGNMITSNGTGQYEITPIKPPRKADEKRQRSCPSTTGSNRVPKTGDDGSETKTVGRRISPPYETIINRHGDRVEYALPYSSDPGSDECEHKLLPKSKRKSAASTAKKEMSPDQRKCEEIVQESYNFLDIIDTDDNGDSGVSFFAGQQRSNVIVTDLDKSLDSNRTLDRNTLASSKCLARRRT